MLDLDAGPGDLDLLPLPLAGEGGGEGDPESRPNPTPGRLRRLLSYRQTGHDFTTPETHTLIAAIEQLRVLDPACGSGAFPMGMLQKLVHVLRKLDPDNALWKAQNRTPLLKQLAASKEIRDPTQRDESITTAQATLQKFDADFADPDYADYARKLYLIEKCLYGVDIQPIAVQIAKLRFFISLVVEQKLGTGQQRLTPLPNLETKIVAANTLLPIPRGAAQRDLLDDPAVAEKETELREANASHFAAKRFADKRKRKEKILRLRDELAGLLKAELLLKPGDAERMTAWDPFDQNRHADFFDPEWMFGFRDGFDIVIGNPPYVRQEAIKDQKAALKPHYPHSYSGTADLYVYFYERSFQLLNPHGCLSFITSNKWFRAKYGADLRQYMATHTTLRQIIDFGDEAVFDALAYPTIVIATKRGKPVALSEANNELLALNWDGGNEAFRVSDFPEVFAAERFAVPQSELKPGGWQLEPPVKRRLLARLLHGRKPLGDYCDGRFYYGIKTGLNEAFVITREQRDALVAQDPQSVNILKPFLRGRDVKRWKVDSPDLWLIYIPWHFPLHESMDIQGPSVEAETALRTTFPAIYTHLLAYKTELSARNPAETGIRYEWYALQRWGSSYWREFFVPKIVLTRFMDKPTYAFDDTGFYVNNALSFICGLEKYAVALLNSSVVWWFLKSTTTDLQGGFLQAHNYNQFAIPIPDTSLEQRVTLNALIDAVVADVSRLEYERLLNGLVYELFFPEDLHAKNIRLFDACAAAGIREGMDAKTVATEIFHPRHTLYGQLFELQKLEVVRLIEGEA